MVLYRYETYSGNHKVKNEIKIDGTILIRKSYADRTGELVGLEVVLCSNCWEK